MSSILELPTVRQRVARITVECYHFLSDQGLVGERTELLRGVIVEKMTKSPLHEFLASQIYEMARAAAGPARQVRKEGPLTLADSEPEPDVAIVAGTPGDFRTAHPSTALLAVEVAVSSEDVDREKISLYAEAGVTEFWLVLPAAKTIEAYSKPQGSTYRERRTCKAGDALVSYAVPSLRVEIDSLFG